MKKAPQTGTGDLSGPHMDLFRIFTEIAIIDQLLQNQVERLLAPDLNLPQFSVLNHMLRCGDGQSPLQLAQAMQVTKGSMTNTIARLAEKGLVTVEPDAFDRRGKRVGVTEAGLKAHRHAIGLLGSRMDAIRDVASPGELEQTGKTLTLLRQWLDAHR